MRRERSKKMILTAPGGFLEDPPEYCPKKVDYCPNPNVYHNLEIVDYVLCNRCKFKGSCERKYEQDRGKRKRIAETKS